MRPPGSSRASSSGISRRPDVLPAEQRVGDPDGYRTAISIHVYGTDVSRIGTSARRYYDLPVVPARSAA
jgi:hypothetical protein